MVVVFDLPIILIMTQVYFAMYIFRWMLLIEQIAFILDKYMSTLLYRKTRCSCNNTISLTINFTNYKSCLHHILRIPMSWTKPQAHDTRGYRYSLLLHPPTCVTCLWTKQGSFKCHGRCSWEGTIHTNLKVRMIGHTPICLYSTKPQEIKFSIPYFCYFIIYNM